MKTKTKGKWMNFVVGVLLLAALAGAVATFGCLVTRGIREGSPTAEMRSLLLGMPWVSVLALGVHWLLWYKKTLDDLGRKTTAASAALPILIDCLMAAALTVAYALVFLRHPLRFPAAELLTVLLAALSAVINYTRFHPTR